MLIVKLRLNNLRPVYHDLVDFLSVFRNYATTPTVTTRDMMHLPIEGFLSFGVVVFMVLLLVLLWFGLLSSTLRGPEMSHRGRF